MKTIHIGDEHGRGKFLEVYSQIKDRKDIDGIYCYGDFFDPYWDITVSDMLGNFSAITSIAQTDSRVHLMLGNHDMHYLFITGENSRKDFENAPLIKVALVNSLNCVNADGQYIINIGWVFDGILCSHAGFTKSWTDRWELPVEKANKSLHNLKYKDDYVFDESDEVSMHFKRAFSYDRWNDMSGWGDSHFQPPTWVRPDSLYACMVKDYEVQIVGHTRTDAYLPSHLYCVKADDFEYNKAYVVKCDDNKKIILVDSGDNINYTIIESEDKDGSRIKNCSTEGPNSSSTV